MLPFKFCIDPKTGERWIETSIYGKSLLNTPLLNKGTAFSYEERRTFNILGKLPQHIETLEEQVERTYQQLLGYTTPMQQNIYLNNLHDRNETVFYRLLIDHLAELMPVIYTPIVGNAVKQHGREFRQPRGIYISYPDRFHIDEILDNRSHPEIRLIVATDGEGVLGIGDQGVGAIDIPIAKLVVYTLCAAVNPTYTLPIMLDVGTNNKELLDDPYYLGWRHERIGQKEYDEFIELFIASIKRKFPQVFLHWEDLGRQNANRLLQRYKDELCTFNDDIQGTGAVTVAAILSASKVTQLPLTQHRVVIFGAGSAGVGIADQIADAMQRMGMSASDAQKQFWLMDRPGLLTKDMSDLTAGQIPYAQAPASVKDWPRERDGKISLLTLIKQVKPTILVGCSTVFGAFDQEVVQTMAQYCEHPIIFPMSNPTDRAEADPKDLLAWTNGKALVATGSPFPNTAQCNNALIFPGLGLGILAAEASRLTPNMIWAACQTLAAAAPVHKNSQAPILPTISDVRALRTEIAKAVIEQAYKDNVAQANRTHGDDALIKRVTWEADYVPLRKVTP